MELKKLAILTDCVHVFSEQGIAGSENHIFIRQMQELAMHFDQVLICCPFVPYTSDMVITYYKQEKIIFHPLPNVGGNRLLDKILLLGAFPEWLKAFREAGRFADIIYQRFPNNLNIPGFFYYYFKKTKVFATYAGTWKNYKGEPFTYRFQKWVLKKYFRGPIWIYQADENIQRQNIFPNFSPSYSLTEWEEEAPRVRSKIDKLKFNTPDHLKLITVGALVPYKNQQFLLEACKILLNEKVNYRLYIVGDGPLRHHFTEYILKNGLSNNVLLLGKKTDKELRELYRNADLLIQSPITEGYGKVPLEGLFHGVIPVLGNKGMAKIIIGQNERGFLFPLTDPAILATLLKRIPDNRDILIQMIENGREYTRELTLENWGNYYFEKIYKYFENTTY